MLVKVLIAKVTGYLNHSLRVIPLLHLAFLNRKWLFLTLQYSEHFLLAILLNVKTLQLKIVISSVLFALFWQFHAINVINDTIVHRITEKKFPVSVSDLIQSSAEERPAGCSGPHRWILSIFRDKQPVNPLGPVRVFDHLTVRLFSS